MKDSQNRTKKQLLKRIWDWIKITFLLLGIICGGVLVYQWWDKKQKLEKLQTRLKEIQELKEQAQRQYQLQDINFTSTNDLVNSSDVRSFFTDLLTTYAKKFAKSRELDTFQLPLKFEGLYLDKKTGNGYGEMGRCFTENIIYPANQKIANISINRLYLLNKLGHDRYFTSSPKENEDYTYLDISFDKMIDTCSHELAHYTQFIKHGKSSCKSDLILSNGKYDEELAKEHEKWTKEIYQLIKQEYSEWERKWKEIK